MTWLLAFGGTILKGLWRVATWIPRQLRLVKKEKKEAEREVIIWLREYRESLKEELAKEADPDTKQALEEELDGAIAAERGYYRRMVERTLERSDLPPYDALVANGKRVLEPENKAKLTEALTRLGSLPSPPMAEEYRISANANYALGRYEEALADLDKALQLRPDDPVALNNRGVNCKKLKRYEEAITAYNRALQLRPDYREALNNRGNTYEELGRRHEARADYDRALELRPDYPEALNNRAVTYMKMERYEEAEADLKTALELRPDGAELLYNMACLFSLMCKPDDAISYLEKSIALDEKNRQDAETESDFDNIRDDPRFRRLIEAA